MSQAPSLRSARTNSRTPCGFCEGTNGQLKGICRDADHRCKGTLARLYPGSSGNPDGS